MKIFAPFAVAAPLAFAALLPLAACGGPGKPAASAATSAAPSRAAPALSCPQVAMLQQAQTLTLFLPGRADVAARVSTAQITGLSGACVLQKGKGAVLVTVNTAFLADNGPANNGAPVSLPWFAAITDGNTVIAKNNYTATLTFQGNDSTASAAARPVKIELPDTAHTADIQILIGFQETPAQLAYAAAHPQAAP
ncbi:hypothetical protein [Acidocella sp.]|uniref:hypothetical protein n=1 Tax=Acidocella sp. TaxID=50710 RepID=UPI002627F6DE|nr:hypothetical protein [Acidocella sp.]